MTTRDAMTALYVPDRRRARPSARPVVRVPLTSREVTPAVAEAIRRQQTRRRARRLSDDASRWATWQRGEHRARRRDVGLRLLLSSCLVMAIVLLAVGQRVPADDFRHVAALVMSGVMFATFVFGILDQGE